jgi:hypothetical protein
MAGFLVDAAVTKGRVLMQGGPAFSGSARRCFEGVRRAGLFAICACIALGAPLAIARSCQHRSVERMIATYDAAQLEPVSTERCDDDGWVLFRVPASLFAPPGAPPPFPDEVPTEYLVAEYEGNTATMRLKIQYDRSGIGDFSRINEIPATAATRTGRTRYFFPVYQDVVLSSDGAGTSTKFQGIALRTEDAALFKGLYRVTNQRDFRFLLNVTLPSDRVFFRPYYALPVSGCLPEAGVQ